MPEPLTIVASWSEISQWRVCPMKHWLGYRQRQPRRPDGKAQSMGKIWHSMMQAWFKARQGDPRSLDEVKTDIYAEFLGWHPDTEDGQMILGSLIWMWDGFLTLGDPFAEWDVVEIEAEHLLPLPRIPGQPEHVTIVLKAIIDLVLRKRRTNRWAVVDHKSTSKKFDPDTLSRDMDMDDQLTTYLACIALERGIPAHKIEAIWNYAVTTDLKKTPRPAEDRFWLSHSARTQANLDLGMREFSESVLDAYARPLDIEPPRHPDKENCRFMCDHRERCYYARSADRPVELDVPVKPDQVPLGLPRTYQGRTP